MVGAIGFEPIPTQHYVVLAGLGWHLKYRSGSQRNNYWTRIGHLLDSVIFVEHILQTTPSTAQTQAFDRAPSTENPKLPAENLTLSLMISDVQEMPSRVRPA